MYCCVRRESCTRSLFALCMFISVTVCNFNSVITYYYIFRTLTSFHLSNSTDCNTYYLCSCCSFYMAAPAPKAC